MTRMNGKWLIEQARQGKTFVSYGGKNQIKEQMEQKKENKYKNIKTNGYDSKKEASRVVILGYLEKSGEITKLQKQVKFHLMNGFEYQGKKIRPIIYIADFVYFCKKNGWIIEDVKGLKTAVYRLKTKLLKQKIARGELDRFYSFLET